MPPRKEQKPYERSDRPGWYGVYWDEHGKRRKASLTGPDGTYEDAVVELRRLEAQARLVRDGLVSRRDIDLADNVKRLPGELLAEWLDELRAGRRTQAYIRDCEATINALIEHARLRSVGDLSRQHVKSWLRAKLNRGVSAKTHNHAMATVRTFAGFCKSCNALRVDPTEDIQRMNTDEDERARSRALTHAELTKLLEATPRARSLYYRLGARAGLRWEEIGRLRWVHVDLTAGYLRLDAGITKSKRNDDLPIQSDLLRALRAYKPSDARADERLFATKPTRITWLRDLRNAGIIHFNGPIATTPWHKKKGVKRGTAEDYRDDRGRVLGRQCLRKTFGTHLAAVEPNISIVAKLMRHSDPRLTLSLYEDARLLDLAGAVNKLNGDTPGPLRTEKPATGGSTMQHNDDDEPKLKIG